MFYNKILLSSKNLKINYKLNFDKIFDNYIILF